VHLEVKKSLTAQAMTHEAQIESSAICSVSLADCYLREGSPKDVINLCAPGWIG